MIVFVFHFYSACSGCFLGLFSVPGFREPSVCGRLRGCCSYFAFLFLVRFGDIILLFFFCFFSWANEDCSRLVPQEGTAEDQSREPCLSGRGKCSSGGT